MTKSTITASLRALALFLALAGSAEAQRDGQRIPKLKKAFVLSNGGPVHWHETVARGTDIMRELAKGKNPDNHIFEIVVTEAAADITTAGLAGSQVLVLNNVSAVGRLLNPTQKTVVETFVRNGGGTAGWHATTDTGGAGSWPWFVNWISAVYVGSASWVPATMTRSAASNDPKYKDILGNLPQEFEMEAEEWYQYSNPAPEDNRNNKVLLSVDPKDVKSTKATLPYVWINDTDYKGRTWQTGFGHLQSILARPDVIEMIYRGVVWAAGGWDLAGCMKAGDPKFNPAATVPCANCCATTPVLVQNGSEARLVTDNLAADFSIAVNAPGAHSIELFDVHGKRVAGKRGSAPVRYSFPEIAKPGIYFARIAVAGETQVKRVERL